jgi:hypothetical protein
MDGPEGLDGGQIRDALVRQWERIADAVPKIDLDLPSRVGGWRNREVPAHLYVQPFMLSRFLKTASHQVPSTQLLENLSSTQSYSELIDVSAREGAEKGKYNFGLALEATLPDLFDADLDTTITTLQVEAITAGALKELLAIRSAHLLPEAERHPVGEWIAIATGREQASGDLASAVPVMS